MSEIKGVRLEVQNIDAFISDMGRARRAVEDFGNTPEPASLNSLGETTNRIGDSIESSMTRAMLKVTALIYVVRGAVDIIVDVFSHAVNSVIELGDAIDDVQDVTNLSADMAQSVVAAARISGTSVETVTSAFSILNNKIKESANSSEEAGAKTVAAQKEMFSKLSRLSQDHEQKLADIESTRTDRLKGINNQLLSAQQDLDSRMETAQATFSERSKRVDEDFQSKLLSGRQGLEQQLTHLEESHAGRTQEINLSLLSIEKELGSQREEIQQALSEKLTGLQEKAMGDIASVQEKGAKDQERIQGNLQSALTSIQEKYQNKRQSLNEKIADPSTNPILRAFFKTQLESISGLEQAETNSAKAKAQAEADAAAAETAAAVQALKDRLDQQKQLEQLHADQEIKRNQDVANSKLAGLQQQLQQENDQYNNQRIKLVDTQSQHESDLKVSYGRQKEDLNSSFNDQVTSAQNAYVKQLQSAQTAQASILAETNKRIGAETAAFAQQSVDIQAGLENMGTAATGPAGKMSDISRALQQLGIDENAFKTADFAGQLNMINDAMGRLASEGRSKEAFSILQDLTSPRMAKQLVDFFEQLQTKRDLGFTQEQIDSVKKFHQSLNELGLQVDVLFAQIITPLLPTLQELIYDFESFWKHHGPEVVKAIKDIASWLKTDLIPAMHDAGDFIFNHFLPAVDRVVITFNVQWTDAINQINKALGDIETAVAPVVTILDVGLSLAVGSISEQFTAIGSVIDGVARGFDAFKRSIEDVVNFVNNFFTGAIDGIQDALNGIHIPDILHPGSPSPFEESLRGITDAMGDLNRISLHGISFAASPAQMGAGGGNRTTNNAAATINMTFNGSTDSGQVRDATYSALVRAGFVVVK